MRRRLRATTAIAAGAALLGLPVLVAPAATAAPAPVFRLHDPRITEASGLAVAERTPGVVFVQNDSGDSARFFAVDERTGATIATIRVRGARNVDWEDIAAAPDAAGTPSVWLADIGDNNAQRSDVSIYRVPEPRLAAGARGRTLSTAPAAVWRLRYPDGPQDAESFAVTPGGTGYVVTKSVFGTSGVYRIPAAPSPSPRTMHRVGTVHFLPVGGRNPFGIAGDLLATGASVSRDGRLLAIRTYGSAYVWRLRDGAVGQTVRQRPVRFDLPTQRQGEGVAFAGRRLLIDSEGVDSPVYSVALPRSLLSDSSGGSGPAATAAAADASAARSTAPAAPSTASTPSTASASPARTPASRGRSVGAVVIGVLFLLLVVGTSVLFERRRRRRFPPDDTEA